MGSKNRNNRSKSKEKVISSEYSNGYKYSKFKTNTEIYHTPRQSNEKIEKIRLIKNEILTMRHEELDNLSSDYIQELRDLARVINTIFN